MHRETLHAVNVLCRECPVMMQAAPAERADGRLWGGCLCHTHSHPLHRPVLQHGTGNARHQKTMSRSKVFRLQNCLAWTMRPFDGAFRCWIWFF